MAQKIVILAYVGEWIAGNTDSEIQGQITSDCHPTLSVNKCILRNSIMAKVKNRLFISSITRDTE